MARSTVSNPPDKSRFPDDERINLAIAAAGQIQLLSAALLDQEDDSNGAPLQATILALVAGRVGELAETIEDALHNANTETLCIREIVERVDMARHNAMEAAHA